jgi:hypothetical protein
MQRRKYSRTIAIAVALVAGAIGATSGVGAVSGAGAVQALAGSTTTTGLVVSVAYAENVGDTGVAPTWFPTPWCTPVSATSTSCSGGANPSNVTMIGQPDPNVAECTPTSKNPSLTKPYCWDEGAVRLDNPTGNNIVVSGVAANVRCNTSSGMLFYGGTISPTGFGCGSGRTRQLWAGSGCSGCFFPLTIAAGKSVILTGNPPAPAHQYSFVSFDSSDTPHMNTGSCPPSAAAPTVTIASSTPLVNNGATVTDMLTDSGHVLDTGWWINGTFGGVDSGWCPKHQNESVQWQQIGWPQRSAAPCDSSGTPCGLAATLTLSPASITPAATTVTETATLKAGDGPLANAPITLSVTSGPNKGTSFATKYTDGSGQASWTYSDANGGGTDNVIVTGGFVPPYFTSNTSVVNWGGAPPTNDFSMSASSVNVAAGSSGTSTISTAVISGSAETVSLSASGLPSGASASISPSSVTAGNNSTMTISTMASTPGGVYTVTVTGTAPSATHTTSVTLTVSGSPPPPSCSTGWTCADVGSPALAGSASVSNTGTWTIQGAGGDIHAAADQFQFVSKSLAVDGSITARIDSQTNTNAWAKAGLMFRADSSAGAANFTILATPGNGIVVQDRLTAGGTESRITPNNTMALPEFVRITRAGTSFSAFTSPNGTTWTQMGSSVTIAALSGPVREGMAVTSHNSSALCTVTMDMVTAS